MRPSLALLLTMLAAEPAHAWVCSRVVDSSNRESGPSLSWSKRDLTYAFFATGTSQLPADETFALMRASFQTWAGVQEARAPNRHTDITFTEESSLATRDLVGYDFLRPTENHNLLIFRDTNWPHPGQSGSSIIALTTTTYSAQTGEILDADIEFNSAGFRFMDCVATACDTSRGSIDMDLMNTAVHEIGHVLGLGHPNVEPATDAHCDLQSTMCSTAQAGDVDKRSLADDDRNAVVFKYPSGAANGYCNAPSCASNNQGCGSCTSAECVPWTDCGFCSPPTPLVDNATITVTGFDDGRGGCDCTAGSGAGVLWVCFAACGLVGRRRRPSLRKSRASWRARTPD
jgi:hypothetical protein